MTNPVCLKMVSLVLGENECIGKGRSNREAGAIRMHLQRARRETGLNWNKSNGPKWTRPAQNLRDILKEEMGEEMRVHLVTYRVHKRPH